MSAETSDGDCDVIAFDAIFDPFLDDTSSAEWLSFEALIEDDGSCISLKSPYDLRDQPPDTREEVEAWSYSPSAMDKTKSLSDFYADLCKDRRVKAAFKEAFGPRAKRVIEEMCGEVGSSDLEDDEDQFPAPEEIIHDLVHNESEEVAEILGAAPDDDEFPINVMRFRNVYWIRASEFDDVGYFDTPQEAEFYAADRWEPFITALAERDNE